MTVEEIGAAIVVLADVSGSMVSRFAELKTRLGGLWPELRGAKLIAFNDLTREVEVPANLPEPMGGTALDKALDVAASLSPSQVIVLSDGLPNDEDAALKSAGLVPCVVDVIFVGDENNRKAIAFMSRLARSGGGQCVVRDLNKMASLLAPTIREFLALPAPIAM